MKLLTLMTLSTLLILVDCKPPTGGDGDASADGDGDTDADGAVDCTPGNVECDDNNRRLTCNESGDGYSEVEECADPTPICDVDLGCVVCRPTIDADCDGDTPLTCNAAGTGWDRGEPCNTAAGQQCSYGRCTNLCDGIADTNSYVGCEYWAVDLPNAQSSAGQSPELANFAVVISNGHETATATIEVYGLGDDVTPLFSISVPPNDLRTLEINPTFVPAEQTSIAGTGVNLDSAFRIVSNVPVTAYQFNPLNNTDAAYSNDASLLLPINGLGTDYIIATADGMLGGDSHDQTIVYNWGAFVTVVAIEDNTEVTVTPTWEIQGGGDIEAGTDPVSIILNRFDVLNIESMPTDGPGEITPGNGNLSGTYVHATSNVAVFSGNVATIVPYAMDGDCCADHVEEQMIPLSAWGRQLVVAHGMPRRPNEGDAEPEYYRITGGNPADGLDVITISYSPEAPNGAPTQLHQGESVEFSATEDFIVDADGPVMVTSYFVSSHYSAPEIEDVVILGIPTKDYVPCFTQNECANLPYAALCQISGFTGVCVPIGDPSMMIVPPVEQFRDSYVFLAPLDYIADAITVIAPMGTGLTLDGAPITDPLISVGEIEGTEYGVLRVLVPDGTHRLTADGGAEVGLLVYGMDRDVSYGYLGGLDLEEINII